MFKYSAPTSKKTHSVHITNINHTDSTRNTILVKKPAAPLFVKKAVSFYRFRKFIPVFKKALHLFLSQINPLNAFTFQWTSTLTLSPSIRFSCRRLTRSSFHPHSYHMNSPSHPPWFRPHNYVSRSKNHKRRNTLSVNITKFLKLKYTLK